jgi:predicted Rossmann-fold nucleotide-binding protein
LLADQAKELGKAIATAGLDLACGPGTGITRHVIDAYRACSARGTVRFYLPLQSEMEAVGEPVEPGADSLVQTEFDYPMRNVYQVKQSQGLFVLTGGDGSLEEILPAVIDYGLPVAIVDGAGSAARAMRALLDIYPEWSTLVTFGTDVGTLVGPWLDRVLTTAAPD